MHVACCMLHVVMLHAARSCCVLHVARSCCMCCRVCPPWPAAEIESTASRMREPSSWKDLTSSCRSCRTNSPSQYPHPQWGPYGTRHGEAACVPGLVLRRCQRAGGRGATRLRADGMARGAGTPWKVLGGTRGYSWREAQAHLRRYTSVDLDARDFLRTRKQLAVAAASALQLWQG